MKKSYLLKLMLLMATLWLGSGNIFAANHATGFERESKSKDKTSLTGERSTTGISLPFQSDFSEVGGSSTTSGSSMPLLVDTTMPAGFLVTTNHRIYGAGQKLKFGTGSAVGTLTTDVIQVGDASTIEVKFNALAWAQNVTAKTAKVTLTYGTQSFEIIVGGKVGWPVNTSDLIEYTHQFTAISEPTSLVIATTAASSTNECRMFLDNVRISEPEPATQVATPTITPASGTFYDPFEVTIATTTEDATIYYTTDESTPTALSTRYAGPFTVSSSTVVKAIAAKEGMDTSTIATATYTFPEIIEVANIRAFKEANTAANDTSYKITGDVTFVFRNGRNVYVEDATGGLLIYDNSSPVITTQYEEGDVISGGIIGTYASYNGLAEMIPLRNTGDATVNSGIITPTEVTIAEIEADYLTYESRLVKITDVVFNAGTFSTTSTGNIIFHQGDDEMTCRNNFRTLEMTIAVGFNANVIGFPAIYNTTYQLFPRANSDIEEIVTEDPAISIVTPEDEAEYTTEDTFNLEISIANFIIGTDGNLKIDFEFLTQMGLDNPFYCTTPEMFDLLSTIDIQLPVGDYTATVSLVNLDSTDLDPVVSATVNFHVVEPSNYSYIIDFEAEIKTSFSSTDIILGSPTALDWNMTEVLIGDLDNDWKNGTKSARFRDRPNSAMTMLVNKPNGIGNITFQYRRYGSDSPQATWNVEWSSNGEDWTTIGSITATADVQNFSYDLNQADARIRIITIGDSSNKRMNVDDIMMTDFTATNTVSTPIISPASGNYYEPIEVSITTLPEDAIIYYTTDGSEPTALSTRYTAPFALSTDATVKAFAAKEGMDTSNIATATYTFTLPTTIETIAQLKALAPVDDGTSNVGTDEYLFTGKAIVTFTANNRNQKIIEDATGAILIDDPNGIITTAISAGDSITNIAGTLTNYFGLVQLVPINATITVLSSGNEIPEPVVVTINQLTNDYATYESRLLKMEGIVFTQAQTFTTTAAQNANFRQGEETMVCRNNFRTLNMSVAVNDTGSIVGFPIKFNTTYQIAPRVNADIILYEEPGVVATPTFNPAAGTYYETQYVTISTTTEGATIYYTIDGSDPTTGSTVYATPIEVDADLTIKAMATKTDWSNSEIVEAIYTIISDSSEIIYSTGFEAHEAFEACTTYNNTEIYYQGAEDMQWGTFYGTPSTTNPLHGSQSMQMRWYTGAPTNLGYTFTDFDLHNVTRVTFHAANTNGLNVKVAYTTDGGATYQGESIFSLTSNIATYQYEVSATGEYDNVRLRFTISLPETAPTSTSRVYLDSVIVYGITGIEPTVVATPTIAPNSGTFYEPQEVTISCATPDATIRYTLDGSEPTTSSTIYTAPFQISETTTVKARAWKGGLTQSNIATATYTFPTEVSNIQAFKDANTATNSTVYKITGDVTFVHRTANGYMYVKDATGGLLIYDNVPIITTTYNEGDVITGGIYGTYDLYHGLVEMKPTRNTAASTTNEGPITPIDVTVEEILNDYNTYESQLVKITNITFSEAHTFNTDNATSAGITQNEDAMICRNQFKTMTLSVEEGYNANITGFPIKYDDNFQIAPRNNEDVEDYTQPGTVATPVFSPASGTYNGSVAVTITSTTANARIYYTTDGSTPDESSTLYTSPVNITASCTMKAIAYKEELTPSEIAQAEYVITVGIGEADPIMIALYPNPAHDILTIGQSGAPIDKIEIFTINGQSVYAISNPETKQEINVQNFSQGIYMVRISSKDSVLIKKFVKQ